MLISGTDGWKRPSVFFCGEKFLTSRGGFWISFAPITFPEVRTSGEMICRPAPLCRPAMLCPGSCPAAIFSGGQHGLYPSFRRRNDVGTPCRQTYLSFNVSCLARISHARLPKRGRTANERMGRPFQLLFPAFGDREFIFRTSDGTGTLAAESGLAGTGSVLPRSYFRRLQGCPFSFHHVERFR